jgi:myo-inositol 2-dehydrogenase/D-chiro-inositol 1-dehydrogenase
MTGQIGVGIVGAGPVVQAIHLPTLARLADLFAVRALMDVDEATAALVGGRVGASPYTRLEDLLADPAVDVVAICSPHKFHAQQVIAALRAGKRAVLCEKPLAMGRDEADLIAAAVAETGVPLIVGAMHTFDPAWLGVLPLIEQLRSNAHTIRSSIVLPFNARFEDWATEVVNQKPFALPDVVDDAFRARMMEFGVLGLAIHDIPIVRAFLPDADPLVTAAAFLEPFGYAITMRVGDVLVDVFGLLQPQWQPQWEFEAISADARLHIDFTPSFVHAGSAVATLTDTKGTQVFQDVPHNGYEGEWRAIAAAVNGDRALVPDPADLVQDLMLALDIADQAADLQITQEVK